MVKRPIVAFVSLFDFSKFFSHSCVGTVQDCGWPVQYLHTLFPRTFLCRNWVCGLLNNLCPTLEITLYLSKPFFLLKSLNGFFFYIHSAITKSENDICQKN